MSSYVVVFTIMYTCRSMCTSVRMYASVIVVSSWRELVGWACQARHGSLITSTTPDKPADEYIVGMGGVGGRLLLIF